MSSSTGTALERDKRLQRFLSDASHVTPRKRLRTMLDYIDVASPEEVHRLFRTFFDRIFQVLLGVVQQYEELKLNAGKPNKDAWTLKRKHITVEDWKHFFFVLAQLLLRCPGLVSRGWEREGLLSLFRRVLHPGHSDLVRYYGVANLLVFIDIIKKRDVLRGSDTMDGMPAAITVAALGMTKRQSLELMATEAKAGEVVESPQLELLRHIVSWDRLEAVDPLNKIALRSQQERTTHYWDDVDVLQSLNRSRTRKTEGAIPVPDHEYELRLIDHFLAFSVHGALGCYDTPASDVIEKEAKHSPSAATRVPFAIQGGNDDGPLSLYAVSRVHHFRTWLSILEDHFFSQFSRRVDGREDDGTSFAIPLGLQLRLEPWLAIVLSDQSLADALCETEGRTTYEKILEARFIAFHTDAVNIQLRTFRLYIEQLSGHVVGDGSITSALQLQDSDVQATGVGSVSEASLKELSWTYSASSLHKEKTSGTQDRSNSVTETNSNVSDEDGTRASHVSHSTEFSARQTQESRGSPFRKASMNEGGRPPSVPRMTGLSRDYVDMESYTYEAAQKIWLPKLGNQAQAGGKSPACVPSVFRERWDALVLLYAEHALKIFHAKKTRLVPSAHAKLLLAAVDVLYSCAAQPLDALKRETWISLRDMLFDALDVAFEAIITMAGKRRKNEDQVGTSVALVPLIHTLFVLLVRSGDRQDAAAWQGVSRKLAAVIAPRAHDIDNAVWTMVTRVFEAWGHQLLNLSTCIFKFIEEGGGKRELDQSGDAVQPAEAARDLRARTLSGQHQQSGGSAACVPCYVGVVLSRMVDWEKLQPDCILAYLEEVTDFGFSVQHTGRSGLPEGGTTQDADASGSGTRPKGMSSSSRGAVNSAWPAHDVDILRVSSLETAFALLRQVLDLFPPEVLLTFPAAYQRDAFNAIEGTVRVWLVGAIVPERFFRCLPDRSAGKELRQIQKVRAHREKAEQKSPLLSLSPKSVLDIFGRWLWAGVAGAETIEGDGGMNVDGGKIECFKALSSIAVTGTRCFRPLAPRQFDPILRLTLKVLQTHSHGPEDEFEELLRDEAVIQSSSYLSRPHITPHVHLLVIPFINAVSELLLAPTTNTRAPRRAVYVAAVNGLSATIPLICRYCPKFAREPYLSDRFVQELISEVFTPREGDQNKAESIYLALLNRVGTLLCKAATPQPHTSVLIRCIAIGSLSLLITHAVHAWSAEISEQVKAFEMVNEKYVILVGKWIKFLSDRVGDETLSVALTALSSLTNLADFSNVLMKDGPDIIATCVQSLCREGYAAVVKILSTEADMGDPVRGSVLPPEGLVGGSSNSTAPTSTTHLLLYSRSSESEFEDANAVVEDHPPQSSVAGLSLRCSAILETVARWLLANDGAAFEQIIKSDACRLHLLALLEVSTTGALPQIRVLNETFAKAGVAREGGTSRRAQFEQHAAAALRSIAPIMPKVIERRLKRSYRQVGFQPQRLATLGIVADRIVDALMLFAQRFPVSGRPDAIDASLVTEFTNVPGVLTSEESVLHSSEGCVHVALHHGSIVTLVASPEGTSTTVLRSASGTYRWAAQLLRPHADDLPPKRPEIIKKYARVAPAQMINPSIATVAPLQNERWQRRDPDMREVVEAWGRPGGAAEALSRDDELDSSQDGDASSASGVVASSLSSFEGSLAPRRRADAYASSAFEESDDLQEFSVDGSQAADGEGGDVASTSVDSYVGIEEEGLLLNEMQLVESTLEDVDPLKSLLGRRGLRNVDIAYDDPTLLGGHFLLKLAEQETKSQSFERVAHTVYTGDAGSRDADTPSAGAVVRFGSLSSGLASSSKQHPGDTLAQLQMHACHGSENKQIGLICMDRMLCRALETLLKAEFASENLEFLLRVKRFETRARRLACYVDEKIALWEYETSSHSQSLKAEAARLCEMALRIFADHCTPESERQVNLTAKQIREVGDIVKSGNIDSAMFTPAVREVERMIKNDKLQRLFQTVTAAQERVRKFNELLRLDEEMSFHSRVEQRCIDFKTSGKLQPQNHRSLEPVRNTDETSQEPVSITRGMSEANSSDGRPSRLTDMRTQSLKQFMDIHDDLPEELRSESEAGFSEVGKDFLEMENCSAATALAGPRIFMSCMGLLPLQGLPFRTVGSNAGRNGTADLPQALLLDPNASIADRASSFEKGTSAAVKSRGRWPAMAQMLQELDAVRPRQTVSVAVVYVGPGQRTAQECLSNVSKQIVTENPNDALSDAPSTSPDFEAFVDALGWSVVLSKHAGWAGDLDTSPNSADGVSQPYWCDESVEVIFYVAPRMPTVAGNSPQPAKKRLISHASIVVVYFDAAREFLPSTLAYHNPDGSSNADVTVVVQPCRKVKYSQTRTKSVTGLYRISLYTRRGIPAIAALPLLDGALVDRKTLGPLVRRAAINADRAIRRMQVGPYWGSKAAEELVPRTRRKRILQRIAKMYGVKFTDEKLLEMTLGLRSES